MSRVRLSDNVALGISPVSKSLVGLCQRVYRLVCDIAAFHEANSLQFRQSRKSSDRVVSQVRTTAQVDISNSVAAVNKPLHGVIGNLHTVTQVKVVQVLSQMGDCVYGGIRYIAALSKNEVAETRRHVYYPLDGTVGDASAGGEVKDT